MTAAERDRLRAGRVLIVGIGGLGAPAALSLAAAGVGTLGLIDSDVVELSNLHRQIIYRSTDLGRPKVIAAMAQLTARYPHVKVEATYARLTADNLPVLFPQFDFVIDGTDQVASKYLVNDGAVLHRVAYSHAGVTGMQAQTMTVLPAQSACFRCLFPTVPAEGDIPTCQEAGVIGAVAGAIGLLQAAEALKYLLGIHPLLADRLLTYDAATARWRTVVLSRDPACVLCGETPMIRTLEPVTRADCDGATVR